MQAWKLQARSLSFDKSLVMGILNLTSDSFSEDGISNDVSAAVQRALQIEKDGADILDIGAESTRPGAEKISSADQLAKILPVLKQLRGKLKIPVSIDTTLPDVAAACLAEGAEIINDVSGLRDSAGALADIIAQYRAGLILMHRRGDAQTMQKLAVYEDLAEEVALELKQSVDLALARGVAREAIVIDPGFGFSKTAEQNWVLLREIQRLEMLGFPVLLGVSRKSFIGKVTGRDVAAERDFGTAACMAFAFSRGIRFFRVHDVKAARDVFNVMQAIHSAEFVPNARLGCL